MAGEMKILGQAGSVCESSLTLLGVRQAAGNKNVCLLGEKRSVVCRPLRTVTARPYGEGGYVVLAGITGTASSPASLTTEQTSLITLRATSYQGYRFDHWTRNGVQTSDLFNLEYILAQDDNWIAYFVGEEIVFDVYASAYPQDTGSGIYWTVRTTAVPEVPQSVQVILSGYLRRPNGDIESFQGMVGAGESLVTPLRYTDGEDTVTIGNLDATTSTPGYRVGTVDYSPSRMLSDSLEAGYSPWGIRADDDDGVPPVGD